MSGSDVDTIETMGPRLSDTDAEALIAGQPVAGVPPELSDMLSMMRDRVTTGPNVRLTGALCEFVEESVASVTPIRTKASTAASPRTRSLARKAVAGFAIVPAKIFIGATMAAAAVGGAQALGVVDVPMLPGSGSQVVSSVPAETLPPRSSNVSTTPVEKTVPVATDAVRHATAVVPEPSASNSATVAEPVSGSPQTIPTRGAVVGEPWCEFGQKTSGRRGEASNDNTPVKRPDKDAQPAAPAVEPCDTVAPEHASTTAPLDSPSSRPVDRSGGNGASPSVPVGKEDPGGSPAPPRGSETQDTFSGGGATPADPSPDTEQPTGARPADSSSDGASIAETPKDSERGRTPSGG